MKTQHMAEFLSHVCCCLVQETPENKRVFGIRGSLLASSGKLLALSLLEGTSDGTGCSHDSLFPTTSVERGSTQIRLRGPVFRGFICKVRHEIRRTQARLRVGIELKRVCVRYMDQRVARKALRFSSDADEAAR